MANLDQVTAQIRFELDQLSSKNAHHEFEHLCRHLTRARICSNILPATGPVSAGGDQGRDFETFRTYLNNSSIADSTFIGLASSKPIAFACTLQDKAGVSTKIKSDVKTIMSSGAEIEAVHYFCSADLDVAKRHKIKNDIKEEYNIELEIHDGQSISELLADREVFWIAEKYLSIPGEIFPRLSENDGGLWYSTALNEWKDKIPSGDNFSEFAELKVAARHAFYTSTLKQDLPFWVNLLKKFIDSRISGLKRRAIYEVCVISLRAFNSLDEYQDHLRYFFSLIPQLDSTGLQDASVLVQYCVQASARNILQIDFEEISGWHHQIIEEIDKKLAGNNPLNVQASLLNIKGWITIATDPLNIKIPDFEKAIEWWLKLTEVLKYAPMFPLKQFASNVADLLKLIIQVKGKGNIPKTYFELTEKIDELLAKRVGRFTAAESSRKRAFALAEHGEIVSAIDLLHHSKIDWFASETLEQALSMMLFLSRAYADLGLFFAAKYYALAVAFIAENNSQTEVKQFMPFALMRAATWDYITGAFCSFLITTELEIRVHQIHAYNAGDLENNSELQSLVFHLLMLKAITERIDISLKIYVEELVEKALPKQWVDDIFPENKKSLDTMNDDELKQHLINELSGIPFNDLEPERNTFWLASGIKWSVTWDNNYETTKQAEQFLAILQIYLVELSKFDLCLLETDVEVTIELSNLSEIKAEPVPSNERCIWKVFLPRNGAGSTNLEDKQIQIFSVASDILLEVSLLPADNYLDIMENLFKKGLSNRIFVAQPYEVLYSEVISEKDFNKFDRKVENNLFSDFQLGLVEHEELSWNAQPGPTYSREQAEQFLKNRYDNGLAQFQLTVEILRKTTDFKKIINELKSENWLDWQIMSAITHVAMNYQYSLVTKQAASRKELDEIWNDVYSGKIKWQPVPPEEFSKENLLNNLRFSMLNTIELLGLENHQLTPNIKAVDSFLRFKYNYWTDDVPHEDFFKDII